MTEFEKPLNPLPVVVWILVTPMILVEAYIQVSQSGLVANGGVNVRVQLLEKFALFSDLLRYEWASGDWFSAESLRLLSYSFVEITFTGAVFSVVLTLAIAKFVGEIFSLFAVLVLFLGSAIFGGLLSAVLGVDPNFIAGAYSGVHGLIGGLTYILYYGLSDRGIQRGRAFKLFGALIALQFLLMILFSAPVPLIAHIGAFLFGGAGSFLVAPGQASRVLQRIRNR